MLLTKPFLQNEIENQYRTLNYLILSTDKNWTIYSAVFSGGAGGARAPPEFGGSQKGRSLISAYQSLADLFHCQKNALRSILNFVF